MKQKIFLIILISALITSSGYFLIKKRKSKDLHENITVTIFWVGEEAGEANENISNIPSAWDSNWVESFGGG